MRKYIFIEYRDSKGLGSEIIFDTAAEAVEYAKKEWSHFCDHDKNTYRNDVAGRFDVFEIEITEEQLETYHDGELDTPLDELWTATIWNFKEEQNEN